jgi:LacI family transcriptional regulator
MVTIKDVAKRARVSAGTVSNVISGSVPVSAELHKRVQAAIRELDYHPNYVARSLKVSQTHTLGVVISDITNPFFPLMVRGAEDAALKHGFLLITFNTDDQVDREKLGLSLLRARRVDGLMLVVAPNQGDVAHIRNILRAEIPIVCLDRLPQGIVLDSVSVDNVKGAQTCVRHLISQGHRRIAIITGPMNLQTARDRLKGYRDALQEAGITPENDLILEGDFREASGYRLSKELLLRLRRPTAVLVSNGMMTIGVVRALEEVGLHCPADIAVASFDDLPFATAFRPHLTAVVQPAYEIGYQGADLLIKRVQQGTTSRRRVSICLQPELRIRESTSGNRPVESRDATALASS